ncbi:MAG: serine/threonine protein kinase [Myxococcaceae bacterium]|nr:serine/threonine protein kinase [Myxococcaceae bacterium]
MTHSAPMFGIGKKRADDGQALTQPIPAGWKVVDLGLLGSGGMSRVYRVRDDSLGREVAFKVLRPELAKEDSALDRFIEEARITAQLDHPNIPPVYALATDRKKSTCFTMKLLEGKSLQQLLESNEDENVDGLFAALEVLVRVCDAVAFAHARGILHLDLKPSNVMVGEFGQIYLVDWGLARRKDGLPAPKDDDETAHGTPAYMAPEQARGQNHALDERTDIFALGGMLYRILAGRPPYVAATGQGTFELAMKANIHPPEQVATLGQLMPRRLVAICMRALSPDPTGRYQTVGELKRELEDFIRGTARLPEQHYKTGDAIITEGETGDAAYVILDGHCQATRVIAGKTQMLRLLGQGEMFGETAVLTGAPRSATVTALMDTTVAVVDRTYLQEEMERTSLISLAIRTVAASFLDLNGQTAALLEEQTKVKAVELALTELALTGRAGMGGSRWVPWRALLARVATTTGLTPEVITERFERQPGLEIEPATDRLVLKPKP